MLYCAVLDEKNSAIIVEDIGDEELQQPDNLDNVDIVDFGPEGGYIHVQIQVFQSLFFS